MEYVQQRCVDKVCRFLEKGLDPNFHDADSGGEYLLGACLPWCSISSSFQNSLKMSGHQGYEFLEFRCWNLVPFMPNIGFQLFSYVFDVFLV